MIAHIMADCFGKVIPRAYAFVSKVVGTLVPTSDILVKNGYQEKSQVTSIGRRPDLIKNDTELLSLLHQPTHCLHKVRPIGRIEPRGAQDEGMTAHMSYCLLPKELGSPIHTLGAGDFVFGDWEMTISSEDIICRDMDEV